jgi:hypothetical protein
MSQLPMQGRCPLQDFVYCRPDPCGGEWKFESDFVERRAATRAGDAADRIHQFADRPV